MRKPIISTSSLVLGLALLLPACSHDQSDTAGEGEKPRHAVQGEKLRDTMRELAKQTDTTNRLPSDPPPETKLEPEVFEETAKLASELAKTAETIPTAKRDRTLSEAARGDFEKLAMDLSRRATDFEAAAKTQNVELMKRSFKGLRASCIACHSRFFNVAGDLDFPRAAATPGEGAAETFASAVR